MASSTAQRDQHVELRRRQRERLRRILSHVPNLYHIWIYHQVIERAKAGSPAGGILHCRDMRAKHSQDPPLPHLCEARRREPNRGRTLRLRAHARRERRLTLHLADRAARRGRCRRHGFRYGKRADTLWPLAARGISRLDNRAARRPARSHHDAGTFVRNLCFL